MSAIEISEAARLDTPRVYLACPLTGLETKARRQITSDVVAAKRAIESFTVGERLDGEQWPVAVYAPLDHTAPWARDSLDPQDVYRRNLDHVHASDALVVIAENGGSAGVGQELEWAIRLGLPILYLTADSAISRQILGAPGYIQAQAYGTDTATLELHVRNFLQRWRPLIVDGPRRRQSRRLRFVAVAQRLQAAWESCSDPTLVAAQIRVDLRYLEVALSDPVLLSVMPIETVISLAHELGVDLTKHSPGRMLSLPVAALRALTAAAQEGGWSDRDVERLIFHGAAAAERGDTLDLVTMSAWRALHEALDPPPE